MIDLLFCATLAMHDGDSGRCDGRPVRLSGIDAGETAPFTRCRQRPQVWACSRVARTYAAQARTRARQLAVDGAWCAMTGGESYDRLVVTCTVNGRDLGRVLVREGLAIADPRYGAAYRADEAAARRARRGVWG